MLVVYVGYVQEHVHVPYMSRVLCLQVRDVDQLYVSALQLVRSTRPQDATTAAYLFKLLLTLPLTYDVITSSSDAERSVNTSEHLEPK